eukprot:UN22378
MRLINFIYSISKSKNQ